MSAERVAMRAALAALEGRTTDAHMGYREALDRWRDLGLDWDEALTGLEMATVLDRGEPDVAAAIGRSREIFERLRARPFLERLAAIDECSRPVRPAAGRVHRGQRGTEPPHPTDGVRPPGHPPASRGTSR